MKGVWSVLSFGHFNPGEIAPSKHQTGSWVCIPPPSITLETVQREKSWSLLGTESHSELQEIKIMAA
jgi:hypothetical protein